MPGVRWVDFLSCPPLSATRYTYVSLLPSAEVNAYIQSFYACDTCIVFVEIKCRTFARLLVIRFVSFLFSLSSLYVHFQITYKFCIFCPSLWCRNNFSEYLIINVLFRSHPLVLCSRSLFTTASSICLPIFIHLNKDKTEQNRESNTRYVRI